MFAKIAVLGLGKVGRLAAEFLADAGFDVAGFDARPFPDAPFPVRLIDLRDAAATRAALAGREAVLSCLPYAFNKQVASTAHALHLHYFDLTEDVATMKHIRALATSAKGVMAPQCGLAPGFVAIVGAHLAQRFERVRSIRLRVGALPQHPTGLLGYAFNWSPEGVVNEYLNDCEVIEEGVLKTVSAMEWLETVYVGGVRLEAFTTSGGLGTMCETFADRVENLDYKSLRYPGHASLMNFFFHELLMREDRAAAGKILTHAKPPVDEDVVFVHVAAEGWTDGRLGRREFVRAYYPVEISGKVRTAIAWTTAASVAAVIEIMRSGALPPAGFVKQETIPLERFLETRTGRLYAEHGRSAHRGS
jgi:saccharopine dehydrogenase-like NADP-dependent oxidoreductase